MTSSTPTDPRPAAGEFPTPDATPPVEHGSGPPPTACHDLVWLKLRYQEALLSNPSRTPPQARAC